MKPSCFTSSKGRRQLIHLANILIAADDPTMAQELLAKVRRHGYDGRVVNSSNAAVATVTQERPDIVLVAESLTPCPDLRLAKALKAIPGCADMPVCIVAEARSPELKANALAAGIDDVLSPPLDDNKLLARLRPLVRLSIMRAELQHRAATARRFGVDVTESLPRADVQADPPVLVVGPSGADLAPFLQGARLSYAADPFIADDLLTRSNFDAAVIIPDQDPSPSLDLCAQIRNNPRLFNLPVVIVTDSGRVGETVAYHHGASAYLVQPIEPKELQSTVLSLVRRQRLRWIIRTALAETLQIATRDAATGVYTRDFLDTYLADRFPFSASHGRNLTLMFFRVPDLEGIRQRFGEEQSQHLRLQVAQWITSLLRAEDITARFEENEFCVVLPDTPKIEADIVMNRIAGVLAYTDFAVKDVYQPVKVWVRAGAAELQPEDHSVVELIARARQNIV